MKIRDCYQKGKVTVSFEFFPPKTPEGENKLFSAIGELKELNPAFVSVTYGAMGTTRENTLRIVSKIKNDLGVEAAAHLTCVAHTRHDIEDVLKALKENSIENIVALRGDPPKGESTFKPVEGGFHYASELVEFIRSHPEFGDHFALAVAGYPEMHMECQDKVQDLKHLKIKVDQGADAVITQLFFDNADFFDFVSRAEEAGIRIPIVPGIMPVTQAGQIDKFAEMCGSKIPAKLRRNIEALGDDQEAIEAYGIEYATKQCQELIDGGVPGLHFYTLNKSKATQKIHQNLRF